MHWQYQTLRFSRRIFLAGTLDTSAFNEKLNERGREGWELVGTTAINGPFGITRELVATLKRRID
ncbi:MAG: DUF4177 domain-containing protein [Gammaproteobacteria bacterium]|nr:DUF4177 domain-containing protein [Gammaproteobacteria bacterium]